MESVIKDKMLEDLGKSATADEKIKYLLEYKDSLGEDDDFYDESMEAVSALLDAENKKKEKVEAKKEKDKEARKSAPSRANKNILLKMMSRQSELISNHEKMITAALKLMEIEL